MSRISIIAAALGTLFSAAAQTPAIRSSVPGTVVSVNAGGNQLVLKTETAELTLAATDRTQILHAVPGENDPKKWNKMTLAEIAAGDRVVAFYRGGLEQKPLPVTSLVVSTKADLAQTAQKELEDWKKRGTSGIVGDVTPDAGSFTVKVGARTLIVQTSPKTAFHRYSLDSPKPADAKVSTLAEVKSGDQVNVLGNKDDAGTTVQAESVYAGAFRQIAATIVSIDAATGEMKVMDLATKKPLIIRVTPDSSMRKLPEQMAQAMARRYQGGRGGRDAASEGSAPPAGRGAGRGGDIGQMLDRIPAIQLAELKPKDAIMVTTTAGSDPGKVTAVNLLAGVEPILTAAPTATRDIMSGWNLGGGSEGQ